MFFTFSNSTQNFNSCETKPMMLKQTLNFAMKETQWVVTCVNVLVLYIDTLAPRNLKSSWIKTAEPVQLGVKQVLNCTMMFFHSYFIPPFAFKSWMHPLQLNLCRPAACIQVCRHPNWEEEQRYQSKATTLLLQTPPHCKEKQALLQVLRNWRLFSKW